MTRDTKYYSLPLKRPLKTSVFKVFCFLLTFAPAGVMNMQRLGCLQNNKMLCGAGVQWGSAFNCPHSILIFQACQTMGDYWCIIEGGEAGRTHGEM